MTMNAVPNPDDFTQENTEGSDSDSNADESLEYYHPISNGDDEHDEDASDPSNSEHNESSDFHRVPNGYAHDLGNDIHSIDLSDREEEEIQNKEGEEEAASESEIVRAFREDESRRNAPLPPEAAARVVEAMRGISFAGVVPDWADQVPEDRWIDRLRGLRNNS